MKDKNEKFPENVEDLKEFYRNMDKDKRFELLWNYLGETLYMKKKSDLLVEHISSIVRVNAEEGE